MDCLFKNIKLVKGTQTTAASICEILENSATEKLITRCLHFTTSLVLYKQKLPM